MWFQGRGLWVFSALFLRFDDATAEEKARYLTIARKTADFIVNRSRDAAGQWTVEMDREGGVVGAAEPDSISTSGYGSMFAAEGLQEYYFAEKKAATASTAAAGAGGAA